MSKTKGFIAEFKKFIARGNVLDLAVGVIIGGAFSAITNSLVNDIINPILGIFAGGNEALSGLSFQLPGGGALMLGNFINAILNFLIMAFAVFCLVKAVNRLHRKTEETPPPPPQPSREEVLLTETERLALVVVVVRIKDLGDSVCDRVLSESACIVALVEHIHIKARSLCRPETENGNALRAVA